MLTTDQVIRRGQLYDRVFFVVGLALTLICLGLLGVLLFNLLHEGLSRINAHRSGVFVEELTMLSLVQTLATNVPNVHQVKFLVDGKERETLAGHADLKQSYDVDLVAQSAKALQ